MYIHEVVPTADSKGGLDEIFDFEHECYDSSFLMIFGMEEVSTSMNRCATWILMDNILNHLHFLK